MQKAAGIRELKAHLSRYLRDVREGTTVYVTDRGRVVAELRPPEVSAPQRIEAAQRRYRELIQQGAVKPATDPRSRSWKKWEGLGLSAAEVESMIDFDRDES